MNALRVVIPEANPSTASDERALAAELGNGLEEACTSRDARSRFGEDSTRRRRWDRLRLGRKRVNAEAPAPVTNTVIGGAAGIIAAARQQGQGKRAAVTRAEPSSEGASSLRCVPPILLVSTWRTSGVGLHREQDPALLYNQISRKTHLSSEAPKEPTGMCLY